MNRAEDSEGFGVRLLLRRFFPLHRSPHSVHSAFHHRTTSNPKRRRAAALQDASRKVRLAMMEAKHPLHCYLEPA